VPSNPDHVPSARDEATPATSSETTSIASDVPEADALEQARPAVELDEDIIDIGLEVPEADALEQARVVSDDEDRER